MNNQQTVSRSTAGLKTQNTTTTPLSSQGKNLSERTIPSLVTEFLRTKKSSETKKAYQADILAFFDAIEVLTA
jgi:hypothetical protein